MIRYTEEQEAFLRSLFPGTHKPKAAELFNKKFGTNITAQQVKSFMAARNLKTGFVASEGMTAANNGKRMSPEQYEKCKKTMFKKGQKSINIRELHSTRINVDGFREVKVGMPSKWMLMSRYVYKKHIGPLNPEDRVIHLNGNTLDDSPENLMKVSMAELVRINQRKLISSDRELTKAAVLQIRLEYKIRDKEKQNGKDNS